LENAQLDDIIDTLSRRIAALRDTLKQGSTTLPFDLGLSGPAPHIERAERECFAVALSHVAQAVGPAGRILECGYFAGSNLPLFLSSLERPKAGIVMAATPDMRQYERTVQSSTTAEISIISHDACQPAWPLEAIAAAGRTLGVVSGGAFGMLLPQQAFALLENASAALLAGDFMLLTLEHPRDGAILETAYHDYCSHIVSGALTHIGRGSGIEPRSFYDETAKCIRLGAMASDQSSLSWNGTRVAFDQGVWLDMGAIHLTLPQNMSDLHPDFEVEDKWMSSDQAVSLLLLRKT
jgi:hypothetical protein